MAKGKKRKAAPGDIATNRQASYRFDLLDRLETGVVLWLYNVHIPPYGPASRENHDPDRPRKLLAHKREIERLIGKIQERGLTLVPTRIYFAGPHAKVEIALARGKDVRDKRESIRAREQRREVERALKERSRKL